MKILKASFGGPISFMSFEKENLQNGAEEKVYKLRRLFVDAGLDEKKLEVQCEQGGIMQHLITL